MWHGILIDFAFTDSNYPSTLKVFAKRKSKSLGWVLYGVEISDNAFSDKVKEIQSLMKSDKPYYSHFYNDHKVIVVFKDKTFEVEPHISTWKSVIEYGKQLNIPVEQLDFWPNRFQDEIHYFSKDDFVL
jgi:hypothetical protein